MEEKKTYLKIISVQLFCFILTILLGISITIKIFPLVREKIIQSPRLSVWQFLIYFFSATILILVIIFFPKSKKSKTIVYKILFLISVIWGMLVVFSVFLSDSLSLLITLTLVLIWAIYPSIFWHDLLMIFGMAGIGSTLGLNFSPFSVVIILALLSLYDFIAVFKTKHMVKMASSMIESGVVMGLIIPKNLRNFFKRFKQLKKGKDFFLVGGGDIVLPLMLVSSMYWLSYKAMIIGAIFTSCGALFTFILFYFQAQRKPLPALPTISFFSILGYLIYLFFFQ